MEDGCEHEGPKNFLCGGCKKLRFCSEICTRDHQKAGCSARKKPLRFEDPRAGLRKIPRPYTEEEHAEANIKRTRFRTRPYKAPHSPLRKVPEESVEVSEEDWVKRGRAWRKQQETADNDDEE